jgi:two-component system copper resistance phosphate regulon response regulator CusR
MMHILLVEDDHWVAGFIQKGLESEQYGVDIAADGRWAIEMGSTQPYDLILLDVMLPIMDGFEVCRQLRKRGVQVPILMLTARDGVAEKVQGFEIGADDYLTKPFAFKELLARIQALSRRKRSLDLVSVIQIGDLVLDKNTHEASRAGRPIQLTPREFSILEYLMENAGRALSRTMIEEQVCGYPHDSSTNLVDVYIRRLRQKIDHGYSDTLIHTIRGMGYMLKA